MEREHPNPLQDTGPFQRQLCEASAFREADDQSQVLGQEDIDMHAEKEEVFPPTDKTEAREEGARQADSAGQRGNIIDVLLKDSREDREDREDTATKREPGEAVRTDFNGYNETAYEQ